MTEQDDQTSNPAQNWDISLRQTSTWRYITVAPTWLAAGVLFLLMSMTFADVDLRSLFGDPIESATCLSKSRAMRDWPVSFRQYIWFRRGFAGGTRSSVATQCVPDIVVR